MTNGPFCDAKRLHSVGLSMAPVLQIALGLILIAVTLGIHLIAVNISLRRVTGHVEVVRARGGVIARTELILVKVTFLCCALLDQAIICALAVVSLDVVTGFWPAVYFAIVTLTTLGYGDVVPPDSARLVAAFCAVAGLFLVGLSTAFVIEILRRIETDD